MLISALLPVAEAVLITGKDNVTDMKKDYDFDDETSDKAKILVKIIPFALILIILAVSLIVSGVKNKKLRDDNKDLQESIKDYADHNLQTQSDVQTDSEAVSSNSAVTATPEASASPAAAEEPDTQATPTPYKEIMNSDKVNYDKISFNKEEQLKEMMTYWADNNQKALDDLTGLDRFKAMSWKLRGTRDFYYYGGTNASGQSDGEGIAVYADNQYYYGDWSNGVRSGNGTWIHYHMNHTENKKDLYTYHQYTGSWKNDLPDGEGSEHYDYKMELLKENTGYNTNLIGSYAAGLVHGEFYITNIYSDKNTKEWYAEAQNGSWVYQNDNKDSKGRRTVQVEDRDEDNFIWMYPKDNVNIGVPCLISKNKNQ